MKIAYIKIEHKYYLKDKIFPNMIILIIMKNII
jgi:hypothetical protein